MALIEELNVSFQTSYHEQKGELSSFDNKIDSILTIVTQLQNSILRPLDYHGTNHFLYTSISDVLSCWPWIEKSTVEAITSRLFDINYLPKLYREESAHNPHNFKTADRVHFPFDGGKSELVIAQTKMLTAFRDLPIFLSAWHIYMSVRSFYSPK